MTLHSIVPKHYDWQILKAGLSVSKMCFVWVTQTGRCENTGTRFGSF